METETMTDIELHQFYMLLFNMILQADERLREKVTIKIRLILATQSPSDASYPASVLKSLRLLKTDLE